MCDGSASSATATGQIGRACVPVRASERQARRHPPYAWPTTRVQPTVIQLDSRAEGAPTRQQEGARFHAATAIARRHTSKLQSLVRAGSPTARCAAPPIPLPCLTGEEQSEPTSGVHLTQVTRCSPAPKHTQAHAQHTEVRRCLCVPRPWWAGANASAVGSNASARAERQRCSAETPAE